MAVEKRLDTVSPSIGECNVLKLEGEAALSRESCRPGGCFQQLQRVWRQRRKDMDKQPYVFPGDLFPACSMRETSRSPATAADTCSVSSAVISAMTSRNSSSLEPARS